MRRLPFAVLVLCSVAAACGGDGGESPRDADAGTDGASSSDGFVDIDVPDADAAAPDADAADGPTRYSYGAPLDPLSPWPKFRRDLPQTGAAPFELVDDGADLWSFDTGKGIFSSPVIDGDGTIYIGSANRRFHAIAADGTERWSLETGEIIDSSALLDADGRVIFGSGDGTVYALERATGEVDWTFNADDPAETSALINWFEGNIAIGPGGEIYAPNDNFWLYALDRANGERVWRARMPDQTWSLPAVDPDTGRLYVGNNNLTGLGGHLFSFAPDGRQEWLVRGGATMAASPTLVADHGVVVAGAFDGFVRGYSATDGRERWSVAARDHVYASGAVLPSGDVVVPAADGTVYAIDPESGDVRWRYSWGAPMRSSPAVDASGTTYVGTGDGHLLAIDATGGLAWALRLVDGDRDDLNGSPALAPNAIVIAGESGEVFRVPAGYCARTPRPPGCTTGPPGGTPDDGAVVARLSRFGSWLGDQSPAVAATEAIAIGLRAFERGDERLAVIDAETVQVVTTPATALTIEVSPNRQFVTVRPESRWAFDEQGTMQLHLEADWLVDPERDGLQTSGGTRAGAVSESFVIGRATRVQPSPTASAPTAPGTPATTWLLTRLAAPLPTLLPSYNQIGFDSLFFVVGLIELDEEGVGVAWLVEGAPGLDGRVEPIPGTRGMFPFEVDLADGELRLVNRDGLTLEVMSATLSFETFEVAGRLRSDLGVQGAATVHATTVCGDIELYGPFIRGLGLCHPSTDVLTAFGAVQVDPWDEGAGWSGPGASGAVSFDRVDDRVVARIDGGTLREDEHAWSVLLIDPETRRPIVVDYGPETRVEADDGGIVVAVSVPDPAANVAVEAVLIADTYPVARASLPGR